MGYKFSWRPATVFIAAQTAAALPTAISSRLIVEGVIKAKGLRMPPNLPEFYKPALEELKEYGYKFSTKRIRLNQ